MTDNRQEFAIYCQIGEGDYDLEERCSLSVSDMLIDGDTISYRWLNEKKSFWTCRVDSLRTATDVMTSATRSYKACELTYECLFIRNVNESRTEKRLVIFDMDSTLVVGETLDNLAKEVGIGKEISAITAQAMNGEIDFAESFKRRLALLAGTPIKMAEKVRDTIQIQQGAPALCRALRARGIDIAIATGGFDFFVTTVAKQLGIRHTQSNLLDVHDGKLTGKVKGEIMHAESKREYALSLIKTLGLQKEEVCAVGDGANDILMLQTAGFGVAFCAKQPVRDTIANHVNIPDLGQLMVHLSLVDVSLLGSE